MKISVEILLGFLLVVALASATGCAYANPVAAPETGDRDALTVVTHDLCHREVAMLGESATHGDGHTEAFKVALVERLVDECGFDSVVFEASHYEFLNIERQLRTGQAVSAEQVSSATKGFWRFDREFQPIIPFLLAKAQTGQISLGGMDDQLGEAGQDYANMDMVSELTVLLLRPQSQDCSLALHERIYSSDPQAAPESDRAQVAACLSAMQVAVAADKSSDLIVREERQEMISAVQRWTSRDFASDAEQVVGRDRSMFQNFEWLRRQQPQRHKVIVWAATVHIAKQADPTWRDRTGTNFGSLVHQKYGGRAFSLGFSGLGGSYRQGRRDVHEMPPSPPDSVEAQALKNCPSDAVYVGPARLAKMAAVPGAIFRHTYQILPWAKSLDGVVVFRTERPPDSSR